MGCGVRACSKTGSPRSQVTTCCSPVRAQSAFGAEPGAQVYLVSVFVPKPPWLPFRLEIQSQNGVALREGGSSMLQPANPRSESGRGAPGPRAVHAVGEARGAARERAHVPGALERRGRCSRHVTVRVRGVCVSVWVGVFGVWFSPARQLGATRTTRHSARRPAHRARSAPKGWICTSSASSERLTAP